MSITTALTSPRSQTRAIEHSRPLLRVLVWELRRFRASRLFWLQALGFFCLALFVTWAGHSDISIETATFAFTGSVAGTSPWGLVQRLPTSSLMLLGMLLPFLNAEGVTRDLSRHTHELLMTTALPGWAYVWGRFLIGLLMSLGLAVLLLASILGLGLLLHLTAPAYPSPLTGGVLLLWAGMVVPATVLLSSLSFALGTLFPRQATLVKIVILLGWFVGAFILPSIGNLPADKSSLPAWYSAWDPTSAATSLAMRPQYFAVFDQLSHAATSVAQLQSVFIAVENRIPDIGTWFAPHLIEGLVSLLLVVLAVFAFKRFRNAFNG